MAIVLLKGLFYLVALCGLWGLVSPGFQPYIRRTRHRMRMLSSLTQQRTQSSAIFRHLDRQLYLVGRNYDRSVSVQRFIYRSIFIFVGSSLVVYMLTNEIPVHITSSNPFTRGVGSIGNLKVGIGFSLIIGLLAGAAPYVLLRIQFEARKIKAGWALLEVVKTLCRFGHLSLDTALVQVANTLPEGNVLRRPLKILAFTMTSHTYVNELRQESERFIDVIGTTFAVAFISDLLFCYRTGGEWRNSMLRLAEMMETRQVAILNAKMEVSDAIGMGAYGNLIVIVLTCGSLALMIGWPIYSRLQFQTTTGVFLLLLTLISTAISMIISMILSKPRLDYR